MKGLILGFVLFGILVAGCIEQPEPVQNVTENETEELPNPAAINCQDKGYGYEIRSDAAGEYGVCIYEGSECDEWALYRKDCCLQDSDCNCDEGTAKCENQNCTCEKAELPNPASVNCVDKGYELEMRENEAGQYGVCIYEGSECEEWALYRMECCLQDSDCECGEGTPKCTGGNCTCEPAETLPEYSNKTVGEFLDEGLEKVNSEFYTENPNGEFTVGTYTWIMGDVDIKPDQIPVGSTDLESAILFNGEKIRSIRGFGFKTYVPAGGGLSEARAIGVFNAKTTMLDTYLTNELEIKIDFYPFSKSLLFCDVTEKEHYLANDGSWITNYYFYCEDSGPLRT